MRLFYAATLSFIYLLLSVTYIPSAAAMPIRVVVIDAGHGGEDPGAIGITGVKEKDVVLKLALQLGSLIEKNHSDIKVVYTRKTDVFVKLHQRAQIANDNNADLFISIHCNAVDRNSVVNGAETFVMGLDKSEANLAIAQKENASIFYESDHKSNYDNFDPSSPESYIMFRFMQNKYLDQSIKLAAAIQSELKTLCKRADRGVKQAPFMVLWRSAMPSVLVETGFLSNKEEETYLASAKGQAALATAMYNGFAKIIKANAVEIDFTGIDTTASPTTASTETQSGATNFSQSDILYMVQFMTIPQKLKKNDPELKGLPDIDIVQTGNKYRYTCGKCTTQTQAIELLTRVKKAGFKDAFIVTSKNEDKTQTDIPPAVVYRIQFMTLAEKLKTDNPKLKGLKDVKIEKKNNTYIYTSGRYDTYSQAREELPSVKKVGFEDAFIVCYDAEGKRITLQQAQELENKK
ncbi:MAG: N-acetylmuramoyl-L-alanine amidase [Bacteroidales bacterium]|jgi:N-acetylmuramoyl-L-alanine amidase|nr:N-acetylmuramoyl-L-alanine amidase [Bacteroidales bacterium]